MQLLINIASVTAGGRLGGVGITTYGGWRARGWHYPVRWLAAAAWAGLALPAAVARAGLLRWLAAAARAGLALPPAVARGGRSGAVLR